jgi:hypothetical protein
MGAKTIILIGGILVVFVGAADLLLGNTSNTVLPDFIGNNLTQQTDLVLIGLGGLTIWVSVATL